VNELLASAQHAILGARTVDEIVAAFFKVYDDAMIQDAQLKLTQLGYLGKRSERRGTAARERDITEIIKCMQKIDWMGKSHKFAAIDLDKVCRVPAGLGDELVLRAEMQDLKLKFQDLTSAFEDVKQLSVKVSKSADEVVSAIEKIHEPRKQQPTSAYSKPPLLNISASQRGCSDPGGSSRPETPLYSQIMALKYNQQESGTETPEQKADWKVVSSRGKTKRDKKKIGIVGQLKDLFNPLNHSNDPEKQYSSFRDANQTQLRLTLKQILLRI